MTMAYRNAGYNPDPDRYWADEKPDNIAAAVCDRFDRYIAQLQSLGRLDMWRMADRCYHGRNPDGGYSNAHAVTFGGEQGEVAQIHVGHYRQLVRQQHTIATSQRPAIEVTATSNDPEAISDTIVARQLLEYDLDEGGLELQSYQTHERALVYSEAFIVQTWDPHAGELVGTAPVAPEAIDTAEAGIPDVPEGVPAEQVQLEMPVHEGAIRVEVVSPIDCARDLDAPSVEDSPWWIVRRRRHRWNLAARFPESSEKRRAILDAPSADLDEWALYKRKRIANESDFVVTLTLYHPPSDALPLGRQVEIVGEQWLEDMPYPYDHCVVHADMPSVELEQSTGYGDSWDLLALSQSLNATESGMLSVADAGWAINWTAARGQKVDAKQLESGFNIVEYDDEGRGLNPPSIAERPELRESDFKFSEHQRQTLEVLSGINSAVRGAADDDSTSGADRALKATLAVQANSAQQRAYAMLLRSVLNARVNLYREFMSGERIIEVAGRDKTGHVKRFTADTLQSVRRVRVELGPADLRTVEGRMKHADRMLEAYGAQVITPARYMALRTTGRLEDIDDPIADHKVVARQENDLFREGKGMQVQALIHQHHACHMAEHARDLNNLEILMDASRTTEIAQRLQHIFVHAQQWAAAPPELLAATGQEPAPSVLIGAPTGGGAPPGGPPMPANDNGEPQAPTGPGGAALPQLPQNPSDGQRGVPGMPAAEQKGVPAS
jgi:hypothetical protein